MILKATHFSPAPLLHGLRAPYENCFLLICESVFSRSVMSDFLLPQGLYSLPGSSVHGILQARILEWIAIFFSKGSSWPRDQAQVSCIAGRFFTIWATRDALIYPQYNNFKHLCLEYNNRVSKYMKQRKINLRREIDKSAGIAGDYSWKFFLFKYLKKQ